VLDELAFPAAELYAMPAAMPVLLEDSAVKIDEWIASEVEQVFAVQEGAAQKVASLRGRYETLLDRAGRYGQFQSRKARDEYLARQIKDTKEQEKELRARAEAARKEESFGREKTEKELRGVSEC
jgi:hypothetical protein